MYGKHNMAGTTAYSVFWRYVSVIYRLEECEEQLRQYEHMNEKILSESQDKLNNTVVSIVYPLTLRVVLGGVCEGGGTYFPPQKTM